MKKRRWIFCLAALLALVLAGCGEKTQEADAAQSETKIVEAPAVLAEETVPAEPEPEEIPEPEKLPAGEEILLFGARVSTLTDGQTLFADSARLEASAGFDVSVTDDAVTLSLGGQKTVIPLVRSDEMALGDGFSGGRDFVFCKAACALEARRKRQRAGSHVPRGER